MDHGLHVRSVAEMDQLVQRVVVKEEDIKEEQYDYMIGCQDEEEKPFSDLYCTTEADIAEDGTYNKDKTHFAESKTESDAETDISSDETEQTAVEIEVKLEGDEEEQDNLLGLSKSLLLITIKL